MLCYLWADLFLSNATATADIYTLSLHDALPISRCRPGSPRAWRSAGCPGPGGDRGTPARSEEHTSELQSLTNLVCRLLLEKKKISPHKHPLSSATTRMITDQHSDSTHRPT